MAKPKLKTSNQLQRLPSVDELLHEVRLLELADEIGRPPVLLAARDTLARLRERFRRGIDEAEWNGALEQLPERVAAEAYAMVSPSLREVINATGVILHTNLGRAPLSKTAVEAIARLATRYTNLEFDLTTGRRGERHVHARRLLCQLLGAEDALVVNNCAAAVFLALTALAEGGEVVVSRSELVEIGGSFRIPDIMGRSGARLVEVGTTNKTRIGDYEKAIGGNTQLLLRVHQSNFQIVGFTERPALEELVALAHKEKIPLLEDLGGGLLVDLTEHGLAEPTAPESLREGVDLVTISGDKLLGGPQAGILAGRKKLIEKCRKHPLFRALRVDKLAYAALEATLRSYLSSAYDRDVPTQHMISLTADVIRTRAEVLRLKLAAEIPTDVAELTLLEGESVIGGGTSPGSSLPTRLLAIRPRRLSATALCAQLWQSDPPVITRVEADTVLIDLRTVFEDQDALLLKALPPPLKG